jgi:putative transposase
MTDYRRFYVPAATWFFTVNLAQRKDMMRLLTSAHPMINASYRVAYSTSSSLL